MKMKKCAFILFLICLMAGTAFAQLWSLEDYLGGQSRVDYLSKRRLEKVYGLDEGYWFKYSFNGCWIVNFYGPYGNPAEYGPVVLTNGTRRFPDLKSGRDFINKNVKMIKTRPNQTVEFVFTQDVSFFSPSAKCRLFVIQPESEVYFNLEMGKKDEIGFVVNKGNVLEDTGFKVASTFDEVMSMYSCVPEEKISSAVEISRKTYKDDREKMANEIIKGFTGASGTFGALVGAAPIFMIPAQFAVDMVQNILHAQMAYALACCYNNKPADLKDDLYVLFADANIATSLLDVAKAAGGEAAKSSPLELASKEQLLAKIGNSQAFSKALQKSPLLKKVAGKFTAKGIANAVPVISVALGAAFNINDAVKFGQKAKQYYGPPLIVGTISFVDVIFDPNNGTSMTTKFERAFDAPYGKMPSFNREGYKFDGWYTQANGGAKVTEETKVTNSKPHTLYAHWTGNSVNVTFDANGGDAPNPANKKVNYGSGYGSLPNASRSGHSFSGWFTQASGGTKIGSNTKVDNLSDHKLYAHWSANGITVTFNPNGGSEPKPKDKGVSPGNAYGSLPTNVIKSGYKLDGWYTQADGGTKVDSKTIMTNSSNHTLYAHWIVDSQLVTFDPKGGSAPNPKDKGINPGSTYGTLPTTSRDGFTFDGWYTQASGGTKVDSNTHVANSKSHTLYAHWIPDKKPDAPKQTAQQPAAQKQEAPKPAAPKQEAPKPAAQTNASTTKPASAYAIGDKGPNGGIVFDKGKECSKDLGPVAWADADKLAKGLGSGWRMPTKAELNAMYNNLQKNNKGGFKKESYWGLNGSKAYAQNFGAGNDNASPNENEKKWIRAVRSF
jgi:uncharacterized repeat protein (TIGR02543 family)